METSLLNVSPMRKIAIPGPMRLAISSLGFRQNRRFGSYPNAERSDRVERSNQQFFAHRPGRWIVIVVPPSQWIPDEPEARTIPRCSGSF